MMANHNHPLQRIGIQLLFMGLSFVVISWPMVAKSTPWSLSELMSYLFGTWMIGVVLLFLISRTTPDQPPDPEPSSTPDQKGED